MMTISHPHISGSFPLFISGQVRARIQELTRKGMLPNWQPVVLVDHTSALGTALAMLPVAGGALCASSSIHVRRFRIESGEAAEEIAVSNLDRDVTEYLEGGAVVIDAAEVRRQLISFIGHVRQAGVRARHPVD